MKKLILKSAFALGLISVGNFGLAQCPEFTACLADTTISNDSGNCDAVFNYATPGAWDPCDLSTQTFNYTGAMEVWTVPADVYSIQIEVYGAQGGNDGTIQGGLGGYAVGTLSVTPGQVLNIFVGGKGTDGPGSGQNCNLAGGFNGGGPTGAICCSNAGGGAGAGGGASDVRVGGITLADRVIVGAGGGGAGSNNTGANGGGLIGDNGGSYNGVLTTGGTQSAGGQAGGTYWPNHTCSPATDGTLGVGGDGDGNDGGGGGGGYYGGGGGANNGGGGGGSSYIDGVTNGSTTGGLQSGDGQVIISYNTTPVTITQIAGLASGATFPAGTTTNTYVVESQGNYDTCTFNVTVVDTEPPLITCPGNQTSCTTVVTGIGATVSENCSGDSLTYTFTGATTGSGTGDASGNAFNLGITTVQYVVTDSAGNSDSCSFDIDVQGTLNLGINTNGMVLTAAAAGVSYQWINCVTLTPIPGATNQSYTATVDGSYAVIITDGGCSDTSACASVSQASIDETFGDEFEVYPNPTDGIITIDLGNYNEVVNLQIVSIDGKVVYEAVLKNNKLDIDLSAYSEGVYTLRLSNGNAQSIHKVTKQ